MVKDTFPFRNKKAVSEMVSYVLLIVIAISISVFVYAYLKLYLPENRRECEADTKIVITDVTCLKNFNTLSFKMENRGLFTVSGVYVKFDVPNKKVKTQLNKDNEFLHPPLVPGNATGFNYGNISQTINSSLVTNINYELEIEPAVLQDGFLVLCKDGIVTYPVTCE